MVRQAVIDTSEFRRILGHLVTGVAVVTTRTGPDAPCGLTANAIASVSLDPTLVLACVETSAETHDCIADAGFFAINMLAASQERISRHFSTYGLRRKFDGIEYRAAETGAPILHGALAWVDCRVWARYPAGDHSIYVGEVVAGDAIEGTPLLYYRGGYGRFMP